MSIRSKSVLVSSTAILLATSLFACGKDRGSSGSSASTSASAQVDPGKPKVAFLLSTLQEERYQKDKKYFEEKAATLGVTAFTLSADNDNARQLSQVEDALSRGAKVLVIQPTDSAAASAYVGKAHAKGAKVVAYDRSIRGDALDYYVAHDSYAVGKMEAEAAVAATGGKGNYVLLQGQSGHSVAVEIARGYTDVLRPYVDKGDIKIVVEKNHDAWAPEQALKTVEDALSKSKGDIQAILANNSGMARGAVQAVQASATAKKDVFIAGADADAANANFVCEGKQSVEILKDIKPLAEKAAEIASDLALGKAAPPSAVPSSKVPTAAVPVVLVTKANAKSVLVDGGFHDAKQLPPA
ncbi:MAG: substrate-binding domain-containing protein [Polyangiaceae bacterium]